MELALAVELDEERRNSHRRLTDINSAKHFLDELASFGPTDAVLTRLMDSCTETGTEGNGLGAAFAVLHARDEEKGNFLYEPSNRNIDARIREAELPYDLSLRANERCALSWQSGDPHGCTRSRASPWRTSGKRAQEAHSTVAVRAGAGTSWPRGDVSRVVAIGLQAAGESVGVLVAGFREETSSQAAIERSGVANQSLQPPPWFLRERNNEAVRLEARQNAVLLAGSAATIPGRRKRSNRRASAAVAREFAGRPEAPGERQQDPDGRLVEAVQREEEICGVVSHLGTASCAKLGFSRCRLAHRLKAESMTKRRRWNCAAANEASYGISNLPAASLWCRSSG